MDLNHPVPKSLLMTHPGCPRRVPTSRLALGPHASGRRLALVTRRMAYGENDVASGPTYRAHTTQGNRVIVSFDHADGGLTSTSGDGNVGAFAVAGADRRRVWARARVERDQVVVWSDEVAAPVAVRYAWSNSPVNANLYDGARLPAAPFRTDTW